MKIEELHDKLFDVLCIIDDICKSEGIRYYLDSGTELGSVREKDFIPWDDDMDIKILAEDFPKFLKVMKEKLPEHMHIIEPNAFAPYFYDFTYRIYDDRWLLREETEEDRVYNNYQNRVGTDVFLFSKVPHSKIKQKILVLKSKILYGMGMAYRYKIDADKYTIVQKLQVKVLGTIGKMFSAEKICDMWYKMITKWNKLDDADRFTSNYGLPWLRFIPDYNFCGEAKGIIRGREFPIPNGYDEELTIIYGDYMTPPKDHSVFIHHLEKEEQMSEEEIEELYKKY